MKTKAIAVLWPASGEWRLFRFGKRGLRWRLESEDRIEAPALSDPLAGREETAEGSRALRILLQRPPFRGLPVLVVLNRPRYLFAEVDLPAVPPARLASMIPFQLEKAFPFAMEELWFSHLDPPADAETGRVGIFAAPGIVSADLTGAVEQAGATVFGLVPAAWLWSARLGQRGKAGAMVLALAGPGGTEAIAASGGTLRASVWISAETGGEAAVAAARDLAKRFGGAVVQRQVIGESPHEAALSAGGIPQLADPVAASAEADLLAPVLAGCLPSCPAVMTPAGRASGDDRRVSWKTQVVLAAAVVLMFAIGAWQAYTRDRTLADRYRAALSTLEPQLTVLRELEQRKGRLEERAASLEKALGTAPPARDVLRGLTLALPDDTWLSEMTCEAGKVTIKGFSANSSALLPLLEGSPLFRQVRFAAPITQDARVQKEVFLIQAELERTP